MKIFHMKKFILLLFGMYAMAVYSQQTVLKVDLVPGKMTNQVSLSPDKKSSIDAINKIIDTLRKKASTENFIALLHAVNVSTIKDMSVVSKWKKDQRIPNDTNQLISADSIKKIASIIDSIKVSGDANGSSAADPVASFINDVCPVLLGLSIRYILGSSDNNQDNYVGIIEDSTGTALQSFVLAQSNKELFYDKLKKSVSALCPSDSAVKLLIALSKDKDLYTKYLEGKDKLVNTDGLAGTLKIYKHNLVHYNLKEEVSEDTTTKIPYPDIKSLKKAKKESRQSVDKVLNYKVQIDSLAQRKTVIAKNTADKAAAAGVKGMAEGIDSAYTKATRYLDSISNKIPDDRILYYYNKAIQLFREMQALENKARYQLKNDPQGLGDLATIDIPDGQGSGTITARSIDSFTIQEVQIQFQDGFIENIKVFGKIKGNQHLFRFENFYPIGFSTKRDFRNLIDQQLFENSDYHKNDKMYLILGEVISYNQDLAVNNKDYSPANQVLPIKSLADSVKEVPLYKDQTSKIVELQVFSDLKGADNNNPNGLIQVELNKRLNFFSKRSPLRWKFLPWYWCSKKSFDVIGNIGLFNFVTPQFSIDKIENNQKRLILSRIDTLTLAADTSKPITYASTINLLRHQIYRVGFDLSWLVIDVPGIKSTFNFGTGIHFGRSAIQDTVRVRVSASDSVHMNFRAMASNNVLEYGINTFQWGPYFTWQIFPDSRFGVSATQRFTWYKALTSNFVQVRDSVHYLRSIAQTPNDQIATRAYSYYDYGKSNDWFVKNVAKPFSLFTKCIASAEIFAYFNANSNGNNKLFFRYRLNWDLANPKENFHQVQVGFSTYLTATKEYDKLKKASNID